MKNFNRTHFYYLLNGALLACLVYITMFYYNQLPEKIPMHFDLKGTPDSWAGKGSIKTLLFVCFAFNALFYLIIIALPWIRKHPSILNMPGKKKILSLPIEKQKIYWDTVKEYLAACAVSISFVWLTIMLGTIRVALEIVTKLPGWAIWPGMIIIALVNIYYISTLIRTQKRLIKDAEHLF